MSTIGLSQAKPRIVFASPIPPFPLDGGGPIRVHRLLTGLAKSFETTFVTFDHHPDSGRPQCRKGELQERLPGVEVEVVGGIGPQPTGSGLAARAAAILSPHSSAWGPYLRLTGFRDVVRRTAARTSASLVHFDFYAVGLFGPVTGCVNVYAPHNIDHQIVRAAARHVHGRRRVWAELDWRKLRRDERLIWKRMDLCLAVSELDAAAMHSGGARRVEICPNGTDPVEQLPFPRRRPGDPLKLVFVGHGEYPPYARGLSWFVKEVLPRVRTHVDAELDVVGRRPHEPEEAVGVRYVGSVPSVAPWYASSHAAIVPVFEGSGTRLKIPEALAYGRPVVSTALGAEGLPLQPGKHFLEADDAGDFASSVVSIARAAELHEGWLESMLRAGREAVEPVLWPHITAGLVELYKGLVGRQSPVPDQSPLGVISRTEPDGLR